jgi:hypothetical protein
LSQAIQPADPLVAFCTDVVSENRDKWPPSEHALAEAFLERFSLDPVVLSEVVKVCNSLGIEVTFVPLPFGLHGLNGVHGQKRHIVIAKEEAFPGGKVHTLLHELREVLEYSFADLGYPTVQKQGLERRAEEFASMATMLGMQKVFVMFFTSVMKIETTWKRWLAGAALCVLGVPVMITSAMYPHFEDAVIRARLEKERSSA